MDLQSMVDVTSFGKLLKYLHNDPSTSGLILIIDDRLGLVDVAENFISTDGANNVRLWIKAGQIIKIDKAGRDGFTLRPSTETAVEVIQLVPFFILKSLKKRYE